LLASLLSPECLQTSDPSSVVEFSDVLYGSNDFVAALARSLSPGGVLVTQVGHASDIKQPARVFTRESVLDNGFISDLKEHGFIKVKEYTEGHGGFMGVWAFLVAFRDARSSERWHATEAEVDLSVRRRMLSTRSGSHPLHFFDGSAMQSYSYPSRIIEEIFCRIDPAPGLCGFGHGYNPERPSIRSSSLAVGTSRVPGGSWGVFFKEAFPKDMYVVIDQSVNGMLVLPRTKRIIKAAASSTTSSTKWDPLASYILGNGSTTDIFGDPAFFVHSGVQLFINRPGCKVGTENEAETSAYDPFIDRNHMALLATVVTIRDVKAGDELADNLLVNSGVCLGEGEGPA
jgi:hypothetical protein